MGSSLSIDFCEGDNNVPGVFSEAEGLLSRIALKLRPSEIKTANP